VLRERTQAEQVTHEEHQQQAAPSYPQFELELTCNNTNPAKHSANHTGQSGLTTFGQHTSATNPHARLYASMHGNPGYKAPFTPQQATSCKYPIQFLCDLAYAVLKDEAGNLLENCHLMKHPKHKEVWTKPFSKEIVPLATTTETIFFIKKNDIPEERGNVAYGRFICVYGNGKKDKFCTCITMGATS
jgi:hypothetical protein